MWPRVSFGADENCNRAITFVLWPLGHLNIWWEPKWRTSADGPCEKCRAEARAEGCCEWCGSRPCNCTIETHPQGVIEQYQEMLAYIALHIKWRYVTRQLTTEQKELFADAVEASSARAGKMDGIDYTPSYAPRWWRDDYIENPEAQGGLDHV